MTNIISDFDIVKYTTFGVPAICDFFVEIHSIEELNEALDFAKEKKLPLLPIGGGSNMLFSKPFKGLAIKLNLKGIEILSEDEEHVVINAKASEAWHTFVTYCVDNNYGGLENLSLIPGNVGTSPMQNIGAYGVEIKNNFFSLKALNIKTREIEEFDLDQCKFGYRESFFKREAKGQYIILEVAFKLTKKDHKLNISYGAIKGELETMGITNPSLKDISTAVIQIRESKLPNPSEIGNAGSFFKNPTISKEQFSSLKEKFADTPSYHAPNNMIKVPAGWLIEQCGWKGKTEGNAGVYQKQSLVLINNGGATGEDIYNLSTNIINSVVEKFGIELEREVNII